MTAWKIQNQSISSKPSYWSNHQKQFYQVACDRNMEKAKSLDTLETNMCTVCEKLEKASQAAIQNNQLFQIEEKDGKPTPAYDYIHHLDELYETQKREILKVQQTSFEALEQFFVTYAYQVVQISQFTSTMEECLD